MWLLFVFGMVSWLVALAGLSAVQDACGRYGYNRYGAGVNSLPGPGPQSCPTTNFLSCSPVCETYASGQQYCTYFSGGVSCSKFFNYQWWQIFYQLFVLVWLMLTLMGGKASFSRGGMLALLSIATLQMLDWTGTFGSLAHTAGVRNSPGSGGSRVETCFAGGIMLCFANFALIMAIGLIDRGDDPGNDWVTRQTQATAEATDTSADYVAALAAQQGKEAELTPVKERGMTDETEAPTTPTL